VFVEAQAEAGASILHADLDAFYASVEQRDRPALRGRPVIVGGGVVLAASYEARRFGVRTAMGGRTARELCPGAVVVPPRMQAYSEASRAVFDVFNDTTPFVEGISIDEAFLDVGGLRRLAGTPFEIARRLRSRVRAEVGLPLTVGVARTKFLAKVASGVAKPDGLLVVEPEAELDFLHPLPVSRLWGVGVKTEARLARHRIHTVGEVARLGRAALVGLLGPAAGNHLYALANNHDPRRVEVGRRRRSVGSQRALGRAPKSRDEIDAVLLGIVDRVAARMRSGDRVARTVVLRIRFGDFTRITRSATVPEATDVTTPLLHVSRRLLDSIWPDAVERGLTLVGISLTNLHSADAVQLVLPFERRSRAALDRVVDEVRDRYGRTSLVSATLLGRDGGLEMPLLPDEPS
jgi:DNA polymerase-4